MIIFAQSFSSFRLIFRTSYNAGIITNVPRNSPMYNKSIIIDLSQYHPDDNLDLDHMHLHMGLVSIHIDRCYMC